MEVSEVSLDKHFNKRWIWELNNSEIFKILMTEKSFQERGDCW